MYLTSWICCQIGAREHYAIPRALDKLNRLNCLITDSWVSSQSIINKLPDNILKNLKERFHPDLTKSRIFSFTESLIAFELQQKLLQTKGWNKIIARNDWFQKKTVSLLKKQSSVLAKQSPICIFAYSYAALEIFRYAKSQGWYTILGQIDPAIIEEELVINLHQKYKQNLSTWQSAPSQYWQNWQEECQLADQIIVNSQWSNVALQKTGISEKKIKIVPLAYESDQIVRPFVRNYPSKFTRNRPLRVLFLGQVILRKGIMALLEAADLLKNEPIEFWIVGSLGITIPEFIQKSKQIHWSKAVSRSATKDYYQKADVFLFPTLSDGFGLTQLEAQAWKLPIIASKYCGEVVRHTINGLVLDEVSAKNIAEVLLYCLKNPQKLQLFSERSIDNSSFSLSMLANSLNSIF